MSWPGSRRVFRDLWGQQPCVKGLVPTPINRILPVPDVDRSRQFGLAIDDALRQASLTPSDIGLIVSHAMGDPLMDAAEREALPKELANTPMVAPIASLGHTGAASGGMELVTGVMALANHQIPPTLNVSQSAGVRLLTKTSTLDRPTVLCISHTSEGSATAIILH